MRHPLRQAAAGLALAALAALVAGCGDSRVAADPPPPAAGDNRLPASALASVDALMAFLRTLGPNDSAEPLALDGVVLPVSDTAEPVALGPVT